MFAQHPYGTWPWAGGAWVPADSGAIIDVIHWPHQWCPAPGPGRTNTVKIELAEYGDGYRHRTTRGLNPVQVSLNYTFPFTTLDLLNDMDAFLQTHGAAGFYFLPPDKLEPMLVCCNEWAATISDRSSGGEMVGMLTLTLARRHNYQPISVLP